MGLEENQSDRIGNLTSREEANTHVAGSQGSWYEIRVRGHLGPEWSDWFGGLELRHLENGEMVLSGCISDQGALIGILLKLNRLNLALLSIRGSER